MSLKLRISKAVLEKVSPTTSCLNHLTWDVSLDVVHTVKVVFVKVNFGSLGDTIPVFTKEPPPAMLTAVILPVLLEDISMPAFQVELHILLLQVRCSAAEEAACVELPIRAAGVSMVRVAGGRHHSSSCSRGEEVGHPVLCGEVQLQ